MDLGRASIPKYLLLTLVGAIGGLSAFFVFRSAAWERGILAIALLILAGFMVYVVWLLVFKNKSTRTASTQQMKKIDSIPPTVPVACQPRAAPSARPTAVTIKAHLK